WSYSNGRSFFSQHLGGAYRLPNGNTLAVLGTTGMVYEITPARQVVWTLNLGGQAGRATKYPRDFASGAVEGDTLHPVRPVPGPTIARGVLHIDSSFDTGNSALLDASGRHLLRLKPGVNDLRCLAPGVYFVRAYGHTTRVLLTR
ncbi:MAG: hypothetical protein ABIK86_03075, partial [candidate division WOR-3 bacterium]